MTKAINIEFIIILITVQCVNLNIFSDNKEKKLLMKHSENNSYPGAIIKDGKLKECKYFGDTLLCNLDHLKQWKKRRRLFYCLKQHALDGSDFNTRAKRSSLQTRNVRRLHLTVPLEVDDDDDDTLISEFKERWPVDWWRQYGFFTDDYLLLINSHWLRFAPPDPSSNYTLGALYILMMLIGCSGNFLVLVMYYRSVFKSYNHSTCHVKCDY